MPLPSSSSVAGSGTKCRSSVPKAKNTVAMLVLMKVGVTSRTWPEAAAVELVSDAGPVGAFYADRRLLLGSPGSIRPSARLQACWRCPARVAKRQRAASAASTKRLAAELSEPVGSGAS